MPIKEDQKRMFWKTIKNTSNKRSKGVMLNEIDWRGMPEYVQEKQKPYAKIVVTFADTESSKINVRFANQGDLDDFVEVLNYHERLTPDTKAIHLDSLKAFGDDLGQTVTNRTKSLWHPKLIRGLNSNKYYKNTTGDRTNPKYPVYVISKGRAKRCLTAKELVRINVPFKLVVEPQEAEEYAEIWGEDRLLILPFSNLGQGSVPARNWVWNHSFDNGDRRHWIIDDNIENFHYFNRNVKAKVMDGTIFRAAEDYTDRYKNVGMSGFNYYSFCKATDDPALLYFNTRIYSCILIDNDLPFNWRGKYNEDTDLSLRVLKSGRCTLLFNIFLAGKVTTQRMKGGNTEEVYGDTDKRREFAESLQGQHPDVVEVVWKFNRWHHQVNYKPFKSNLLELKEGLDIQEGIDNYGMELIEIEK